MKEPNNFTNRDPDIVLSDKLLKYTGVKFVTHYSEKIIGRRVQYCGETGVGKDWPEETRKRVGVIQGFDKGYLHIKWEGEENVKKFVLILHRESGPEYQFKFHHSTIDSVRTE